MVMPSGKYLTKEEEEVLKREETPADPEQKLLVKELEVELEKLRKLAKPHRNERGFLFTKIMAQELGVEDGYDYSMVLGGPRDWEWPASLGWAAEGMVSLSLHGFGLIYTNYDRNTQHGAAGAVSFVQLFPHFLENGCFFPKIGSSPVGVPREAMTQIRERVLKYRRKQGEGRKLRVAIRCQVKDWEA